MAGISLPIALFLFLLRSSSSFPLCTNSRAPIRLKTPLRFCSYSEASCCNAGEDDELQKRFLSMNITRSDCGDVIKSILCAKCDPYSSDLFTIQAKARTFPLLCDSTSSNGSENSSSFCTEVWNACKDTYIQNSPFSQETSSPFKLSDQWKSPSIFCDSMRVPDGAGSVCFNGSSASFNRFVESVPPQGICVEKIGNGSYLTMAPHPDGSNRVFLSNQAGTIWLAGVPAQGSGGILDFDESKPFLDLTDLVHSDTEFGLMGLAFHPEFSSNGRFFVSFNCDRVQIASCSGRCSCNSEMGCDPSMLGSEDGGQPCRYQSVISEFTVNSSSSTPSEAAFAIPTEVRRIFTMGLPYTSNHPGQILFGPEDGYLYFMMGDGGNKGDPFNFAQNKKSVLGKILRLDVDQMPSSTKINDLGLWGNYSIPKDNPYTDDSEMLPEIWALGLRNPWRCSFDAKRPSYLFCADVGEEIYEEINLISKGGNYGWRVYEGPYIYNSSWTPGGNTSLSTINPIFSVMGYNHSSVNNSVGSASITGGYVYRSGIDPCLNGRFIYADLYGDAMWAGIERPQGSGIYTTTNLPFACAKDSPLQCESIQGTSLPSLGILYSFAEDNAHEIYMLASKGVYRIVRPSRCDYTCPLESRAGSAIPPPGAPSSAAKLVIVQLKLIMFVTILSICFSSFFRF